MDLDIIIPMNNAAIFLLTHVTGTSSPATPLAALGDRCLAPARYLFHGRNVQILNQEHALQAIDHVASFHAQGTAHHSRTSKTLHSAPRSLLRTATAIIALLPGLLLGLPLKGLTYLSHTVRDNHALLYRHFTPIDQAQLTPLNSWLTCERQKVKIAILDATNCTINLAELTEGVMQLRPTKVVLLSPQTFNLEDATLKRAFPTRLELSTSSSEQPELDAAIKTALGIAAPRLPWSIWKRERAFIAIHVPTA